MSHSSGISVLVALLLSPCFGQQAASPVTGGALPVKRVVLYKNGVGYFEHVGPVRGNQNVTIPFTSGQLNDVLKSLTVLDLNGGRITGVAYDSAAPVDRQLGDLNLPLAEKSSLTDLLGSLRGARLEIRSASTVITGRLLSAERKTRIAGGTTLEVDYLSLIGDNGEVRTTELAPGYSVKLLDPGLAGRVERLLDIVSAGREADVRRMVISTEGAGDRSVFVSYISEVPVWKSTYRIVLGSKAGESPLLQGWAIVDNVLGENWDHVQLSLVAGAPQSFIQNLSQPYYSRRPVVPLPEAALVSPQTYQATLIPGGPRLIGRITDPTGAGIAGAQVTAYSEGHLTAQAIADANGNYQLSGLPATAVRLEAAAPGFGTQVVSGLQVSASSSRQDFSLTVGSVAESAEVTAAAAGVNTSNASMASNGAASGRMMGSGRGVGSVALPMRAPSPPTRQFDAGGLVAGGGAGGGVFRVAADAQELGDLFEYKLKDPITIAKNRSALVPIVQAAVGAEKVSIWNDRRGWPRPQRVLWLTNSSGLTLDGGSFSVMEDETFAGEGLFDPMKPGEKRLVSYATDLALNASSKNSSEQQRVSHIRILKGILFQDSEMRETKVYTFRNEDSAPRAVIVEHPVRTGYTLRSAVQPAETTADWMRFRVRVEPKQTASLVVEESRPISASYVVTNLDARQVDLFVQQKTIDKPVEDALRAVLAQKQVVASLGDRSSQNEDDTQQIFDDQQRLRENMKALKGSPEEKALLQRYTQQLNEEENRLEALRRENTQIEAEKAKQQEALNKMIQDLAFDVRL